MTAISPQKEAPLKIALSFDFNMSEPHKNTSIICLVDAIGGGE